MAAQTELSDQLRFAQQFLFLHCQCFLALNLKGDIVMKSIQMTLDDDLIKQVDTAIKALRITRSAFLRKSVEHYLRRLAIRQMEARHQGGI